MHLPYLYQSNSSHIDGSETDERVKRKLDLG